MLTGYGTCGIEYLELSCGYLSMTRLPWEKVQKLPENVSYADVVKSMRSEFAIRFPYPAYPKESIKECLREIGRFPGIQQFLASIPFLPAEFLYCVFQSAGFPTASLEQYRYTPLATWLLTCAVQVCVGAPDGIDLSCL